MLLRKRKEIKKKKIMVAYLRRDDKREYGVNKMTHSLIDTLFTEVGCLQRRPTSDALERIYRVEENRNLHFYRPSQRYLAFQRLQRIKEARARREHRGGAIVWKTT